MQKGQEAGAAFGARIILYCVNWTPSISFPAATLKRHGKEIAFAKREVLTAQMHHTTHTHTRTHTHTHAHARTHAMRASMHRVTHDTLYCRSERKPSDPEKPHNPGFPDNPDGIPKPKEKTTSDSLASKIGLNLTLFGIVEIAFLPFWKFLAFKAFQSMSFWLIYFRWSCSTRWAKPKLASEKVNSLVFLYWCFE